MHSIPTPARPYGVNFACPSKHGERACKVCEYVSSLRATGNEVDKEKAFKLSATKMVYCAIIDRANPGAGPQVLDKISYKKYETELLALRKNPVAGGDFTDPATGFDLVLVKTGQLKDTRYSIMASRVSTPLGNEEWLKNIPSLDRFAEPLSDAEIEGLLMGEELSNGGAA